MRSLHSITFDTSGLHFQGERDGVRVWHTPDGDGIGLYYFSIPPDIKADLRSVDHVREFYRALVMQNNAALIEVDILEVNACQSVRQIIKVPQQPTGMTYLGSITLPFRDFSYVVNIQCMEYGMTGLRDSIVLAEKFNTGEVTIDGEDSTLRGWMQDPYDSSIHDVFSCNKSESEEYDERFPKHPLSRVRRLLRHVQETLQLSEDVRNEPKFD